MIIKTRYDIGTLCASESIIRECVRLDYMDILTRIATYQIVDIHVRRSLIIYTIQDPCNDCFDTSTEVDEEFIILPHQYKDTLQRVINKKYGCY